MRLICGLIRLDGGTADPAAVRAMAAAMTAPGLAPGLALRAEGPAALAVLDFAPDPGPAQGELPVADDGTWIAADARLDEPVDLAAAVVRFGADLPARLLGDFAIAAWNPGRRELICTRDFIAVRPLAWHHQPGRLFAFASLPKGLTEAGIAPRALDLVALGRQLAEPFDTQDSTTFGAVKRLRAGHALVLTASGVRHHRAWAPDPAQVGQRRITPADAAMELRHLVEQAVQCRLPADGPAACQLSGGLDSSAIAVIAARALRARDRRLHAFSLLPRLWDDTPDPGEYPYIEQVLAQEPDILWRAFHLPLADDPDPVDPELPPLPLSFKFHERCAAAAATAGSGLVLTGAGGDEGATYNGLNIPFALFRDGRWGPLVPALRALAAREGKSLPRVAASRLIHPLLPDWLQAMRRRTAGRLPPLRSRQLATLDFLAPGLRREVAATLSPDPMWRNRPADRVEMFTRTYLTGRNDTWSILGARHGVAFCAPLLDRRIVEFILSLPLERFLADGLARQPYRAAMAGILPEAIRLRTSKSATSPGLLRNVAATKAGLLAQVEALRGGTAADHVDLSAVATAIAGAPGWEEASAIAHRGGSSPLHFKRALPALGALAMARLIDAQG